MIECLRDDDCVTTSLSINYEGQVICNLYTTKNLTTPSDDHEVWVGDKKSCPSGFERIGCFGCYKLDMAHKTWDAANNFCDSLGTNIHLAGRFFFQVILYVKIFHSFLMGTGNIIRYNTITF